MIVRNFVESDIPRIEELLKLQGFEYEPPDWRRMFGSVVDGTTLRIALLNRPTVETYAVVDLSDWATPGIKAAAFEHLDRAVIEQLRTAGYTDQHCWTHPEKRAFARRLQRMTPKWVKSAGPENWLGLVRQF